MGKGRKENLGDFRDLTAEEQRKIASAGGKASVEKRRQRKTMREALEMLMYDVELDEPTKERLRAQGIDSDEHMNHQMVITRSLIAKAEAGDVQAYNAICSMIGEKPAEKVDVSGDLFSKIRVVEDVSGNEGIVPTSEDEIPE